MLPGGQVRQLKEVTSQVAQLVSQVKHSVPTKYHPSKHFVQILVLPVHSAQAESLQETQVDSIKL